MRNKPSVFISYAHKDGLDFTRRISFALGLCMNVFWDRRLQAGDFPTQLYNQIESADYLLLIMSPASLSSEWCKKELGYAEKLGKGITLARIYPDASGVDPKLADKYTYGDFTQDFEQGFRRLTMMMLGESLTSWEALVDHSDSELLNDLKNGYIPALISKTLAEWVIVNELWPELEKYIGENVKRLVLKASPLTPTGIVRQCELLIKQSPTYNDALLSKLAGDVRDVAQLFAVSFNQLPDSEHYRAGETAYLIISNSKQVLRQWFVGFIDAYRLAILDSYFDFNVAEKLRELINIHARRSRYLY